MEGLITHDKAPNRSEWFREWFNDDYTLVYGHRNDAEANQFVAKWPVWNDPPSSDWCLDLGCGGGRFSRAIAGSGLRVVGVDLSRQLLQQAIACQPERDETLYVRADIRHLPLKPRFGMAVSLFTSFGYFDDDAEHLAALKSIGDLIVPGGWLILDLPNRAMLNDSIPTRESRKRNVCGVKVEEDWRLIGGGERVEKEIVVGEGIDSRRYFESVRLFSESEVLSMTVNAGFEQASKLWKSYEGVESDSDAWRMIYFGRKIG